MSKKYRYIFIYIYIYIINLSYLFMVFGREAMTNLDSVLKSRDITLQQRSV